MDEPRKPLPFANVKVSRLPPLPEPIDPILLGLLDNTLARGAAPKASLPTRYS